MDNLSAILLITLIMVSILYYQEYQLRKLIEEHKDYWYNSYKREANEKIILLRDSIKERKEFISSLNRSGKICPICKADNEGHNEICTNCKCQF